MKISVIIPVYNAEDFLKRCLDSVINQTYTDWEVIAIDDGSKDNSYKILSEYASKDSRFRVATQENQGPGYTRNKAISTVNGDYIVFLDADDYIDKNYFKELAACIEMNNSDVIFIDVLQEKPNGELIKVERMSKYNGCSKDIIIRHQMTGKLPWGGCRKAVKTSLLINNDIRYTNDDVGEEALFSFRVLYNAKVISFIDKPLYHYVNYPDSQSKKGGDDPWGGVCTKISDYLQKNGLIDEYKDTLNSFRFTAFIVSMYRRTRKLNLKEALKQCKHSLKDFKENYGFELDRNSLEARVHYLLPFAKLNLIFPIVLVCKLKSFLNTALDNCLRYKI